MKTAKFLAAVGIALGLLNSTVFAQETAELPDRPVGRYQVISLPNASVIVLDTTTGQCWIREQDGWQDFGNPTRIKAKGKAKKLAKQKAPPPPLESEISGPTLSLPSDSVQLTIIQREERAIPGSDGSVRIWLGDITDGQALLSVMTSEKEFLVERASVASGDTKEFTITEEKFLVHIDELRNLLTGDDFARITISKAPKEKPAEEDAAKKETGEKDSDKKDAKKEVKTSKNPNPFE